MLSRRRLLPALALPLLGTGARAANAAPRVVSIGGALTELIYELGAELLLVGVDSTSLHPALAQKLPNVGYARTLSAEGLLSLAPTLIVATEEAGPPMVLRQLEQARVPLHVLRAEHRFEGLLERNRRLGELLDRRAAAQALEQRLQSRWTAAQQQVATLRAAAGARGAKGSPRVLFVMAHGMNQLRIAGQDTAADAMIRYAGALNALGETRGYKALTPEAAIAAAPDVILATQQGLEAAGGEAGLLRLPGLAQTPAGQARRIVALEAMELLGFGPRLPQALGRLAEKLYG